MWFKVDMRSPKPIYDQIKQGIKERVLRQEIQENETIPSIRDLASALRVNPNTVVRAYKELEAEGLIFARPGMGYIVVQSPEEVRDSMKEDIQQLILEVLKKAKYYGMTYEEWMEVTSDLWKQMD